MNARRLLGAGLLLSIVWTAACGGAGSPESPPGPPPSPGYRAEIEAWRAEREEGLRAEDSWLTLVGLFWLEPGSTTFGSDPSHPVVFPAGPADAGAFEYDGERVTLSPAPGVEILLDGAPIDRRPLQDDGDPQPDVLNLDRLIFYTLERGKRHGIRLKDPESPVRTGFAGLDWYPVDPSWRIDARFEPQDEAEAVEVPNATGTTTRMFVPGTVTFSRDGSDHRLTPLVSDPHDTHLFFIFRDATSGDATYGAGRYLYGDLEDGRVVLDFNKAYNMPCVFTPYATCILPPPGNRLSVAVEAGEKMYGEHH